MKRLVLKFLVNLFKRYNPGFLTNSPAFSQFRERVLRADINRASGLEDFQKKDTFEILKVIFKYFPKPGEIVVLDIGCSVEVTKYLSGYIKRIIGININESYMKTASCPPNVELLVMDATNLEFEDKSFDFIFSANVYEHISDLSKCIDEQLRVLKNNGYSYARWDPVWSGARGHHIHADMVQLWETNQQAENSNYKNDGTVIKDWSHLLLSKEEMLDNLLSHFKNKVLVNQIVDYIYAGDNINRIFFDDVEDIFARKNVQVVFWDKGQIHPPADILKKLRTKYITKDFSTKDSQILFAHRLGNSAHFL